MATSLHKKNSNDAWEIISRHINQTIILTDDKLIINFASESSDSILGYSSEKLLGSKITAFIHQENLQKIKDLIQSAKKEGHNTDKIWFILKNNTFKRFLCDVKFLQRKSEFLFVIRELNLESQKKYFHLRDDKYGYLLHNMTDSMVVINKEGNLEQAIGIKELLGYEEKDIIGTYAFIPVHPEDKPKTLEIFNKFIHKGELVKSRHDYRLMNTNGEYIWFEANFRVIQDIQTGEYQILNNLRNINERKKMEKQLKEVNKTKDKLFSIIAHDLKNPLSILSGFAYLLKENYSKESEEEILKSINRIYQSSQQLNSLVENLLNWARAQTKRLTVQVEQTSVNKVIHQILKQYQESLKNKSLSVELTIPKDIKVYADPNMLQVAFRNLLSNAIKYSYPESKILIGHKKAGKNCRIIYIRDYGVGIPEKYQAQIMEDSYFITTKGTNNESGTGLGLKITREFIRKNNGNIWIENNNDKGATAKVLLPVSE